MSHWPMKRILLTDSYHFISCQNAVPQNEKTKIRSHREQNGLQVNDIAAWEDQNPLAKEELKIFCALSDCGYSKGEKRETVGNNALKISQDVVGALDTV